jgi:hypothetical protein
MPEDPYETLWPFLREIGDEYLKARQTNKPFINLHEAYAVLKEEFDEFWEAVKLKQDNENREFLAREEAKQIAAMALGIMFEFRTQAFSRKSFEKFAAKHYPNHIVMPRIPKELIDNNDKNKSL